jgi:uncharacterized protein YndB with AHSA1/START domain
MDFAQGQTGVRELTLTRVYDEPREVVFRAWTDPRLLAKWWGPEGFVSRVCEVDARPGGRLRIDMEGPDGTVYPNRGVFHEVNVPERLVFSTFFQDDAGNVEMEERTTVVFEDLGRRTKLTVRTAVVKCVPELLDMLQGLETGWLQTLDRLARELTA